MTRGVRVNIGMPASTICANKETGLCTVHILHVWIESRLVLHNYIVAVEPIRVGRLEHLCYCELKEPSLNIDN